MTTPVSVLLVDDHDLFREGLKELLEAEGFVVEDAASGEVGVAACRRLRPNVVVMDLNMPGISGIEATRRVLEEAPDARVLMLTVAADDERVLAAIRAGAAGYLLKEARLAEIVAGIQAAAAGRSPVSPGVAGALVASVREQRRDAAGPPAHGGRLTERERAVIALVADGHDNTEIARRLYVSPSTVKNHISAVLAKLSLDNRVQLAAYAVRHGLAEKDPSG